MKGVVGAMARDTTQIDVHTLWHVKKCGSDTLKRSELG